MLKWPNCMCYVYGMCINCVCVWVLIASSIIEIFFFFRDHDIITSLPYTIYMYGMCLLFVAIICEFWKQKLNTYITYSFFFLTDFSDQNNHDQRLFKIKKNYMLYAFTCTYSY